MYIYIYIYVYIYIYIYICIFIYVRKFGQVLTFGRSHGNIFDIVKITN